MSFTWERVHTEWDDTPDAPAFFRAPITGGWLVLTRSAKGNSTTFVPDPSFAWDGKSHWEAVEAQSEKE